MVHQALMRLLNVTSLLAVCFSAAATPSFAATVEQSQRFGTFALITEVRTRDAGEPVIMHVATEWTKLHLRWRSQDGSLVANLTDDGGMLKIDVESEAKCFLSAAYQRYLGKSGEPALWQATTMAVRDLLRACLRVDRSAALSYTRELAQSAHDFETGVEAMKSRSIVLFGPTLKRCRPKPARPKQLDIIDPFASTCAGLW